ncbi:MAG: FeoA family protein [Oscillospiraceae bacterium]
MKHSKKQKTLRDLKPGQRGTVSSVGGAGAVRRRLVDMGITPGTEILMRKAAPGRCAKSICAATSCRCGAPKPPRSFWTERGSEETEKEGMGWQLPRRWRAIPTVEKQRCLTH